MEQTKSVLRFRVAVFALTVFFFIEGFFHLEAHTIGWQFRFLTIWGLVLSMVSAWLMLRRSRGLTDKRFDQFASATAVMNIMVVFLYWRIYLNDPSAFYEDGVRTISLWREYYLHGLGPILQWIDVFFILRGFRRPVQTGGLVAGIAAVYFIWIELIVAPLNSEPAGTISQGLPYRFLNNLELSERVTFYLTNMGLSIVLVFICAGIAFAIRRMIKSG